MDELKQLWGTFMGKVLATILASLIIYLGIMAWKGMNSDIEKRVSANETKIVEVQEDVQELKGDILKELKDLRIDFKKSNANQSKIQSDVSYLKGVIDAERKK